MEAANSDSNNTSNLSHSYSATNINNSNIDNSYNAGTHTRSKGRPQMSTAMAMDLSGYAPVSPNSLRLRAATGPRSPSTAPPVGGVRERIESLRRSSLAEGMIATTASSRPTAPELAPGVIQNRIRSISSQLQFAPGKLSLSLSLSLSFSLFLNADFSLISRSGCGRTRGGRNK